MLKATRGLTPAANYRWSGLFIPSLPLYLDKFVQPLIGAIALEEGFRLNYRKTRTMTRAQRQSFCGITVNVRPNLERCESKEDAAVYPQHLDL